MTVDMFGYKSVEEYYTIASPASKINRVRVPVLCLNAADDPFVPFSSKFIVMEFIKVVEHGLTGLKLY